MVTAGEQFPDGPTGSNLNLAYSSQNPVGTYPASTSGHNDVTGNAWEWTEDHFNPLSGFEVHHVYEDFSTPCFDGKHSSIVGGSFISTGDEASVFARFHFRPHFLQHSGFRLVSSDGEAPATHLFPGNFSGQVAARDEGALPDAVMSNDDSNVYESIELRDMYLGLHFSSSGAEEGVKPILPHPNCPEYGLRFPQRVAELLCTLKPERTNNRALDIGCAVGGSSFELAKHFDHVEAFDFRCVSNFSTCHRRRVLSILRCTTRMRIIPSRVERNARTEYQSSPMHFLSLCLFTYRLSCVLP